MARVSATAFAMVGALALGGCMSNLSNRLIEEEFYGTKPFGPAGTNSVLPPKLDRVDLFSHIARGDFCVHYRILTGVDLPEPAPTATGGFTSLVNSLKVGIFGGTPSPEQQQVLRAADAVREQAASADQVATRAGRAERCRLEVERIAMASNDGNYSVSQRLARAYDVFAKDTSGDSDAPKRRRNEIQDEVLRASEQRCNTYKLYLQTVQSNSSFITGSAATIMGGLGAIFTDAGVARALAGAAGITSGVGAQFQESFFLSIAVPAIAEGIDNARQSAFLNISTKRNSDINGYTLQHALMDAVRYDGACSIPRGLQEVAEAARNVRNPSAFVMQRAIDQFTEARRALNTLAATERSGEASGGTLPSISSGREDEIAAEALTAPLNSVQMRINTIRAEQERFVERMRGIAARADEDSARTSLNEQIGTTRTALNGAADRTVQKIEETRAAAAELDAKLRVALQAQRAAGSNSPERQAAARNVQAIRDEIQERVVAPGRTRMAVFFRATRSAEGAPDAENNASKKAALEATASLLNEAHPKQADKPDQQAAPQPQPPAAQATPTPAAPTPTEPRQRPQSG